MPRPEWIEVGRISRPHGVHGEVRVTLEFRQPRALRAGSHAARPARPDGRGRSRGCSEQVPLTIETVRGDDDFPIVAFAEIPDRDRGRGLRRVRPRDPVRASCRNSTKTSSIRSTSIGLEARDLVGVGAGPSHRRARVSGARHPRRRRCRTGERRWCRSCRRPSPWWPWRPATWSSTPNSPASPAVAAAMPADRRRGAAPS